MEAHHYSKNGCVSLNILQTDLFLTSQNALKITTTVKGNDWTLPIDGGNLKLLSNALVFLRKTMNGKGGLKSMETLPFPHLVQENVFLIINRRVLHQSFAVPWFFRHLVKDLSRSRCVWSTNPPQRPHTSKVNTLQLFPRAHRYGRRLRMLNST